MKDFEDYFSGHSDTYARYRPRYPSELFAYLASITPDHALAWDCATGNGQAALELTQFFQHVIATDASAEQLAHAFVHDQIEYRQEVAEETDLDSGSIDLVTVAVAVHWFDQAHFHEEVKRVLKPGGVLAVWTYYAPIITPELDKLLDHLNNQILKAYWPDKIHYLREGYRTLSFPFQELQPPSFETQAEWSLEELAGFVSSWSASQNYKARQGHHAIEEIWAELQDAWGPPRRKRLVRWPLHLRVGKMDNKAD